MCLLLPETIILKTAVSGIMYHSASKYFPNLHLSLCLNIYLPTPAGTQALTHCETINHPKNHITALVLCSTYKKYITAQWHIREQKRNYHVTYLTRGNTSSSLVDILAPDLSIWICILKQKYHMMMILLVSILIIFFFWHDDEVDAHISPWC